MAKTWQKILAILSCVIARSVVRFSPRRVLYPSAARTCVNRTEHEIPDRPQWRVPDDVRRQIRHRPCRQAAAMFSLTN